MQSPFTMPFMDITLASTIAFTAFFIGLVLWLHRESKREGYPLAKDVQDRFNRFDIVGFPAPPPPKTYKLAGGGSVVVSGGRPDTRAVAAKPFEPWPGSPLDPTGNPLADGVGPAAYAERADTPDKLFSGAPRIEPLRVAKDFHVAGEDPNPVGMTLVGEDDKAAGTIRDVWIDRAEYVARYFEADVPLANGLSRRILVPAAFARVDARRGRVVVKALYHAHFAGVPGLKNPDQVTLLEEDKIVGYFGGGTLYGDNKRPEPVL
jgi:photosynthetic reaction center H subunit